MWVDVDVEAELILEHPSFERLPMAAEAAAENDYDNAEVVAVWPSDLRPPPHSGRIDLCD